ncbi:MAG: hypothetical protein KFF72_15965 [Arthrospira sp. SH-MAG29]|nr:hypothetical protein [Arthrospira sp. SH-MAG29]
MTRICWVALPFTQPTACPGMQCHPRFDPDLLGGASLYPTYDLSSGRLFLMNCSANHHAPHEQITLPSNAMINGWGGSQKRSRLDDCQGSVAKPEVEATIAPAAIPTPTAWIWTLSTGLNNDIASDLPSPQLTSGYGRRLILG